ncbi:hypothetical protein RJ639_028738 [Escallonia herrerae]|uniref:Uncharacterized protein n=1 Tax=Escallonia herrerae TaxID=1293975 RepID=A0AA88X9J2_9ASTE|nr:hypothetical protein RJ639_028738 [Escallonia herrerae]
MARGPATRLLHIYVSKNNLSKIIRIPFSSNPLFQSSSQKFTLYPSFDPKFRGPSFNKNPFSTVAENENSGNSDVNSKRIVDESVKPSEAGTGIENVDGFKHVASRDPTEIYMELRDSPKSSKQTRAEWYVMGEIFRAFAKSGWACNQALALYIGAAFFPTAVHMFRNFFFKKCQRDVVNYLVSLGPCDEAERFLFPIFAEYCVEELQDEMKRFRSIIESADLTKPHTWFPFARAMKRKVIYHCGPTNSGKTYNALQRFMEAKKGIYCSPLRLLAMEVFDRVNAHGVYCSLQTGQEKKFVPFSNHIACTVEMVSTNDLYDVAVID